MLDKIVQITFEDHGQDFLTWHVERGIVTHSEPAQSLFWKGCKILKAEAGERLLIERKGVRMEVKHPVESIDHLIEETTTPLLIH